MAQTPAQTLTSYCKLPNINNQVFLVFALNLGNLICGYGIGISAPCLTQLTSEAVLTAEELGWFAGSLVLGQVVGSIVGPPVADRIGRRLTCLLAAVSSLASWILLSTGHSGWVLLSARALTGVADCVATAVSIIYISEVAETRLRGSYLNTTALSSGLGIALAYLMGGLMSWRMAALVPPFLICIAIPILVIMKESPVYLLGKGGTGEALAALKWYRQQEHTDTKGSMVAKELEEIESSMGGSKMSLFQTLQKLVDRDNRKPFLILLTLFALYPLTGMYSITFFAIDLFEKLGLGGVQTVAVTSALVRVLGTALSSGLMHRFGRRRMYIPSSAVSCISIGLIGAIVKLREANVGLDDRLSAWAMVLLIFLFMFSIGVAIANFPWVLMAEWFSPDLKSLVTATMITLQFGFIFIAVQTTSSLLDLLGTGGTFIYFSSVCALNTVLVVLLVPETHGRVFSSIQEPDLLVK